MTALFIILLMTTPFIWYYGWENGYREGWNNYQKVNTNE